MAVLFRHDKLRELHRVVGFGNQITGIGTEQAHSGHLHFYIIRRFIAFVKKMYRKFSAVSREICYTKSTKNK